jgi:hypothetical protein
LLKRLWVRSIISAQNTCIVSEFDSRFNARKDASGSYFGDILSNGMKRQLPMAVDVLAAEHFATAHSAIMIF